MAMAAAFLLYPLLLFTIFSIPSDANYCVCNPGAGDAALQKNIDYACGHGADCSAIQPNGACYNPNTIKDHCNYAVNSYYQKKGQTSGSCDFQGTATVTANPPTSGASGCTFQSTPSSGGSTTPTTPGTGGTTAPPTSPTGGGTPTTPTTPSTGGMVPPTSPTIGGSPTTPTGGGMSSPTTSPGTGGTPSTGGTSTPGVFPGTTSPGIGFGPTTSPFGSTDNSDGAKFPYTNGWMTLVALAMAIGGYELIHPRM